MGEALSASGPRFDAEHCLERVEIQVPGGQGIWGHSQGLLPDFPAQPSLHESSGQRRSCHRNERHHHHPYRPTWQ